MIRGCYKCEHRHVFHGMYPCNSCSPSGDKYKEEETTMRIEIQEPEFKPVKLVIETQQEFDKIYAIFNYSKISDTLGIKGMWKKLRDIDLKSANSDIYLSKLRQILK